MFIGNVSVIFQFQCQMECSRPTPGKQDLVSSQKYFQTNFKFTTAKRDEEGHVILEPHNFICMKTKKGHLDSGLISKPTYITNGDPYKAQIAKVMRSIDPEGHKKAGHDVAFKPAKVVRDKIYKASYEHMNDRVDVKKIIKDADGHVITELRNFYTNPAKKGVVGKNTFFNRIPDAILDDFEWPRKISRKEREERKLLE
jgi:hypothetical protein